MTYSLPMILKAIASNQIARFAPGLYVKLTGQTGRGDSATETVADIARYYRQWLSCWFALFLVASHLRSADHSLRTIRRHNEPFAKGR